jgi:hypothetical protein
MRSELMSGGCLLAAAAGPLPWVRGQVAAK